MRAARRPRRHVLRLPALFGVALLLLTGCATAGTSRSEGDKPLVLTTFTILADMTRAVGGDRVEVESITKPGAEIHEYEPTPEDVKKASRADLVLANGLGLEAWTERFLHDADAEHRTVSDGVDPMPIAAGASEGKPNPHAWMSPRAAQRYTDTIAEALAELSPEHAEEFRENARKYREQLEQVHTEVQDAVAALPADHRVLLTCEGAFSYLARDTGLSEHYLWPVNSDDQGTAQQIRSAIDAVRQRGVPAVFCESTVSDRTMRQVVEATDARYGGTLYVDSLSEEGGPVPTFLDLLRHDARTITAGLSGARDGADS